MALRDTLDPDSSIWHWIAVDLHYYRTKHGLSCAQLGKIINCNRQTVSNMEAARPGYRLDEDQAKKLDELWSLNKHFQRLLLYAKAGHDPDWLKAHVIYEQRASIIKTYEAMVVPGLLQTPGYARALLTAGRADDVEAWVERRMERQAVLTKPNAPDVWVIMSENALDWPVGGREVMREQLAKLLELAELPNVFIRVLSRSVGAHIGLDGSFKVITVAEGEVVYMEACGGGRLSQDRTEVRERRVRFDRIGADALSQHMTADLIRQTMENLNDGVKPQRP